MTTGLSAGDRVLMIPFHADGDPTHRDCERGTVTRGERDGLIWVRFDRDGPTANGKTCIVSRVRRISTTNQGAER